MKHSRSKTILKLTIGFGLIGAFAWPVSSYAQFNPLDRLGKTKELEKSDRCVANSQQIRLFIHSDDEKGNLFVEMYGDETTFNLRVKPKIRLRVPASEKRQILCLNVKKRGKYGLFVYQDQDENDKFDVGLYVLGSEPFGYSNDPDLNIMGKPLYRDAEFLVSKSGADVKMNLKREDLTAVAANEALGPDGEKSAD